MDTHSASLDPALARLLLFLGKDNLLKLQRARVAVFGLGAVGSFAIEALARSGIGYLRLVDFDKVNPSNLNRQIFALRSSIDLPKIDLAKARIHDIHPETIVDTRCEFFCAETAERLLEGPLDYVIDAIDGVKPKTILIQEAVKRHIPIVSSMGAARKFDPSKVRCTDISEVYNCRLCMHVRRRLHRLGIYHGVTAIWSEEPGRLPVDDLSKYGIEEKNTFIRGNPRAPLPSMIFVPATVGIMAAFHVVQFLLQKG